MSCMRCMVVTYIYTYELLKRNEIIYRHRASNGQSSEGRGGRACTMLAHATSRSISEGPDPTCLPLLLHPASSLQPPSHPRPLAPLILRSNYVQPLLIYANVLYACNMYGVSSAQAYRDLAKQHPSFRERSETTDLIVQISLQPWHSFQPDGVILFRCKITE